jgi:hypothetical protein
MRLNVLRRAVVDTFLFLAAKTSALFPPLKEVEMNMLRLTAEVKKPGPPKEPSVLEGKRREKRPSIGG